MGSHGPASALVLEAATGPGDGPPERRPGPERPSGTAVGTAAGARPIPATAARPGGAGSDGQRLSVNFARQPESGHRDCLLTRLGPSRLKSGTSWPGTPTRTRSPGRHPSH
jgi:hypothetical protein